MEVVQAASDYADDRGGDTALATPTCCCCCCCCCSLVAPEAMLASRWANKTLAAYSERNLRPPWGAILMAFGGGAVTGNLVFFIPAFFVGVWLFLLTVGAYAFIVPSLLVVVLAVTGAQIGSQVGKMRREGGGAWIGAGAGIGVGILILGTVVAVGGLWVLVTAGVMLPLLMALPFLFGAIWLAVEGFKARRPNLPRHPTHGGLAVYTSRAPRHEQPPPRGPRKGDPPRP